MRNEDAKKVIRKLEALLSEGNIRCVIYVGNEAVELAVKDMLSVPFGIHFGVDGRPSASRSGRSPTAFRE